ncbi:MAG TPA: Ig-like domain-containing protein [Rhodocyclaceae bacterium]
MNSKRIQQFLMATLLALTTPVLRAADLTVAEGVVVKFGSDAGLAVRDKLTAGRATVFTSRKDDSSGGAVDASAQTPAGGDWRGLRVEKTVGSTGVVLDEASIRFAGAQGEAGLTLRAASPTLRNLQVSDSLVGLRVLQGAAPYFPGASLLRNGVGLESDGNSLPAVSGGQFVGNTVEAVLNKTPASIVQATSNWWGHASGPLDAAGNPAGQGDAVSTGVNYGQFLTAVNLLDPSLRLAAPATYYDQTSIALVASCLNATEYRIAENSSFPGVPFQPLPGGNANVSFALSSGDGLKTLYAQFRDASGNVVGTSLSGIRLDTQAPTVAFVNPAAGSFINQPISVDATAADAAGIARIEFYVDGQLVTTRTATPYSYAWNVDLLPEGDHTLRLVAVDGAGRSAETSRTVTIGRYIPPPDVAGPSLSNPRLNGAVLADGAVVVRTAGVSIDASDRSGVAHVELALDGSTIATATGSSTYSATLALDNVPNGPHVITWRAVDSVGNASSQNINISVVHALPPAPSLSAPTNGLLTRDAAQTVSGSAEAGSTVQLFVNDAPAAGATTTAGSDGRFGIPLTLVNGANKLQARATDQYGDGPLSAAITVTLDTSVPVTPANLTVSSQAAGKLKLSWAATGDSNTVGYNVYRATTAFATTGEAIKVNASALTATSMDDAPSPDGVYYYRVVALNRVGTVSPPSNLAQGVADATLPKATSIVYAPQGKVDPVSGRIGQGRVGVTVNLSEALQSAPYLSIVPAGGTPLPVDLLKVTDVQYSGSFVVDAGTPSGVANALFSARDLVGNRGTEVVSGATLKLDTEGPALSNIVVTPGAPIKADATATVSANFTLSKAMKPGEVPQLSWLLSGPVRSPIAVSGLTAVDSLNWRGTVQLPTDAGLGSPETLSFSYRGIDDLDNISTKISAAVNRYQVYQGNLPPLGVPGALSGKAQPGGKVQLNWQTVTDAAAYQLYRQGPNDSQLLPYQRAGGISYLDQTPQDGRYRYSVASVRSVNGQESLSDQSTPVDIVASASAPGAPQALNLALTSQGIRAAWQAPLASLVASYNLYRAGGTGISSIAGLTPIKTGIKTLAVIDGAPNPNASAYTVTALDAAGNESAPADSAYLNASLLPVRSLSIQQLGDGFPIVGWTAPNGNLAGYNVYLGPDASRLKLTPSPIGGLNYTDTGYASGERRYTVASVDSAGLEIGRSLSLPNLSAQIVSGLPLKRGIFNQLQVQVVNSSSLPVGNAQAVINVGNKDHRSAAFSLGNTETRLIPVVVGGYSDLPALAPAQVGVESSPNDGEFIKIARSVSADVTDGALVVGLSTQAFTRGSTGKVQLSVENTSEVEVELLTARNNSVDPSDELRFKLLDVDGNVLATQAYKQTLGANVITLASGRTVARIPPGSKYLSDPFDLNVPSASPDRLRVRLEADKLHYHTSQPDEVVIAGRVAEAVVSLADTTYYGEVTDLSPIVSFGDKDIVINGHALARAGNTPVPNAGLKLILNQQGFERSYNLTTDAGGNFSYTFKPTVTDSGLFKVSAIHPDITDRPDQKAFTIDRVAVGPSPYALTQARNYPYSIPFRAQAGPGTSATHLRLVLNPANQPTGALPAGISLQLPAPVNIAERQSINLPVAFLADNSAQATGRILFDVYADEQPNTPIGQVTLNYSLQEPQPKLVSSPSFIETGLAQGGNQIESIQVKNSGLQDALDLAFSLSNPDGSPVPDWVSLASNADGTLAVGDSRSVDIAFAPAASVAEGVYQFRLKVAGSNVPAQSLNIFASITQSGVGSVLFKASDIYTATVDKNGQLIQGLAGATITLQNEDVATVTRQIRSDSVGEALFQDMPAGNYMYRISASNHQDVAGRLQIKPGITQNQPVFLDYNLVTFTLSVTEVTIQDRYDITLTPTFQTDIPAPVVVLAPASVNLPKMAAGEVYYGELTLSNYGLARANHVRQRLPASDAYFRYEFLAQVPDTLEAKQRLTIPYRVVALQSLDQPAGTASGGGCYSYSTSTAIDFDYTCASGVTAKGSAATYWSSASNSTCTGTSGGGGGISIGGGSGGSSGVGGIGGFGGGSSVGGGFTELKGMPPCIKCLGEKIKPPCATCGAK